MCTWIALLTTAHLDSTFGLVEVAFVLERYLPLNAVTFEDNDDNDDDNDDDEGEEVEDDDIDKPYL